jgi:dipeptidyl aminopeptidase/acylaminoacyl peptidase
LHGKNDLRVPVTQAYELYSALEQQNKKVGMLISPETEHVPTDANIIYDNIKSIDEWLKQAL